MAFSDQGERTTYVLVLTVFAVAISSFVWLVFTDERSITPWIPAQITVAENAFFIFNHTTGTNVTANRADDTIHFIEGPGMELTFNFTDQTINFTSTGGGGSGEINTASNLGGGIGVFESKSGVDLQLKSINGTDGIVITSNATDIIINGTGTADNLGNHLATQNIDLSSNNVTNIGGTGPTKGVMRFPHESCMTWFNSTGDGIGQLCFQGVNKGGTFQTAGDIVIGGRSCESDTRCQNADLILERNAEPDGTIAMAIISARAWDDTNTPSFFSAIQTVVQDNDATSMDAEIQFFIQQNGNNGGSSNRKVMTLDAENDRFTVNPLVWSYGASEDNTLSSNAFTPTKSFIRMDTEGSASTDDLVNINGLQGGDYVILKTISSARDIVLCDKSKCSGGNIALVGSNNFTLATREATWMGIFDSNLGWILEISRSVN